ncbi:hypothetical protein ACXZ1K_01130 [Pedobacter sp. PWIIR3]
MGDIATDLDFGREIFEDVPDSLKPYWAGLLLSAFNDYVKNIPNPIKELHPIIENLNRWPEAHSQFSKIRVFLLDHPHFQPQSFLFLAENIAKVTYNATGQPAPFDADSGYYIPGLAIQAARSFNDKRFIDEIQGIILLFKRNEKFKLNFQAAREFLIYRKIDEILWFDWDPIGVNDIDEARDEYRGYISEMIKVQALSSGGEEFAKYLFDVEKEKMGLNGDFERCLRVAGKISNSIPKPPILP